MSVTIIKADSYSPKLKPLTIDKLAIVFSASAVSMHSVQQFWNQNEDVRFKHKSYAYNLRIPGHEAMLVDTSGETTITLQAHPKGFNKSLHTFRLEFNPSKVEPADIDALLNEMFHISYLNDVLQGNVNRIDLTVDVEGASIDSMIFDIPKFRVTKAEYSNGRTLYIGGAVSAYSFTIYDKAAELQKKKKKTTNPHLHPTIDKKQIVTRLEARVSPAIKAGSLLTIENPFSQMRVLYVGDLKKAATNDLMQMYLTAARLTGSTYPGNMKLSKGGRDAMKAFIAAADAAWWDPASIWGDYGNALDRVLLKTP